MNGASFIEISIMGFKVVLVFLAPTIYAAAVSLDACYMYKNLEFKFKVIIIIVYSHSTVYTLSMYNLQGFLFIYDPLSYSNELTT